ncbi:GlxA family transcriptional regulator [Halomonas urumqiensis]|uniref:AraC family transcriptional regulator n=1 Tax=Halomonas urumqiensis TaxID=1684789 RepID=A0A2N7UNL3_9GAMM|nr:GlxA family transcriptional regulator [Halomonas urumqiensis]PMR82034.1 AraC family transcriptional regulator [Halomonas urumqiensis]PTB02634.1 GlxA family transcriptional regulator [Halomonas urumqiensis]GHE21118.1 AraC family transcriptional regulator [Halomonas urumqiensis]
MRLDYQGLLPETVGFLLLPRFSMMAFFSAVEPLRIANRIAARPLFDWTLISEDGQPVTASNGMTLLADCAIGEVHHLPSLAVCSGFGPEQALSRPLMAWLHRLDQANCVLGGIDTGGFLLAEAGLLDGERVTLHWESLPAFQERFPGIETSDELFELGERRFSCAGGAAAMDMALEVIARRHGSRLAIDVSEQLVHERMRTRSDQQRMSLARRLGIHNRRLVEAISLMERHQEVALPLSEVARRSGLSPRQLQRLFEQTLGTTPREWYLHLRLERAWHLLRESDREILSVGLACGFTSGSSFSRAFRTRYGLSPREVRRQAAD